MVVRHDINADDLISRYLAGKSLHALAQRYGVERGTIRRALKKHGVGPRSQREALALKPRAYGPAYNRMTLDGDDIEARYRAGESIKALALALGVSERPITRTLMERNVPLRTMAEANRLRADSMTPEQHRIKRDIWAGISHTRIERPKLEIAYPDRQRSAAMTRERTLSKQMPIEITVLAMLPEGWGCTPQRAVERYNLDFSHGSVAVEVHGDSCHPLRPKTSASRAIDLAEWGWHMLFFWLSPFRPLSVAGITQLVAHAERMDRDPSPERQYVVIGGDGELIATGHLDPVERAIVPSAIDA